MYVLISVVWLWNCAEDSGSSNNTLNFEPAYLKAFRQAVLDEMNLVRESPQKYIDQRLGSNLDKLTRCSEDGADNGLAKDLKDNYIPQPAIPPLELDDTLNRTAQKYAQFLHQNYASWKVGHYKKGSPSDRCRAEGYPQGCVENLGAPLAQKDFNEIDWDAQIDLQRSAKNFVRDLLIDCRIKDLGHRKLILKRDYRAVGLGYYKGRETKDPEYTNHIKYVHVQNFGQFIKRESTTTAEPAYLKPFRQAVLDEINLVRQDPLRYIDLRLGKNFEKLDDYKRCNREGRYPDYGLKKDLETNYAPRAPLPALKLDDGLNQLAQAYSERNYRINKLGHDLDGYMYERCLEAGYLPCGENGSSSSAPVGSHRDIHWDAERDPRVAGENFVLKLLIDCHVPPHISELSHRKNILDDLGSKWTRLGVGYYKGIDTRYVNRMRHVHFQNFSGEPYCNKGEKIKLRDYVHKGKTIKQAICE